MEKIVRRYLFFLSIVLSTAMFSIMNNIADRDLWHRLAVGSIFFQTGHILHNDIFAYTLTKPLWVDHEWLTGVVLYFLGHNFGDLAVIGLKLCIFLSIILLIYKTHKLITGEDFKYRILYYIVSIIAILPVFTTNVRSHVFTYLFFTLWIYVLERIKRGENRLAWVIPATMVLWANLHGGFLAGIGLLIVYTIGEALNGKNVLKYLLILASALVATLINPYGIKLWTYLIPAVLMKRPYIIEWYPLNLFGPITEYIGYKLLLVITALCYLVSFKKVKSRTEILVLLTTLYLSIKHQRHVGFFAISASIFCFEHFNCLLNRFSGLIKDWILENFSNKRFSLIKFSVDSAIYTFLIGFSIYMLLDLPLKIEIKDSIYPVNAVEFIKTNNLKGNLLVPFNWGSYALWNLYPQCLIAMDGRYEEVYKNESYLDVTNFALHKKSWNKVLSKFHNDLILIPVKSETFKTLQHLKTWRVIYKDSFAAVLIPTIVKNKKYIVPSTKYGFNEFNARLNQIFS